MKRNLDNIMFKKGITLFIIFIIVYIIIGCFFKSHFLIGTSINGIDLSCMNLNKATNHIKTTIGEYRLLIEGRENSSDIDLSGINFKYIDNDEIDTIVKKQNSFLWIIDITKNNIIIVKICIVYCL